MMNPTILKIAFVGTAAAVMLVGFGLNQLLSQYVARNSLFLTPKPR